MSLYYNKKLISGVRDVPSMTLAEYNALTNKPKLWERTDAPSGDRGINADDIEYDNGVSVKEKIDNLIKTITIEVTTDASGEYQTGDYAFNFISGYVKGEKTLVFCRVASNNERRLILRNSDNMTPIANATKNVTYSYY